MRLAWYRLCGVSYSSINAPAPDGKGAIKAALLMLAKLDALRPGDVLRVDADG